MAVAGLGVKELPIGGGRTAAWLLGVTAVLIGGAQHWASIPGPTLPQSVSIVTTASISLALLISIALLSARRNSVTAPIALISCGYLFLALMGVGRLLTFPGAILPDGPVLGRSQIGGYAYLISRLGFGLFMVISAGPTLADGWRTRKLKSQVVAMALMATATLCVGILGFGILAEQMLPPLVVDGRFTLADRIGSGVALAIGGFAIAFLWNRRAEDRLFYALLSLTMVGFCADLLLKNLGGGQFTFGWYLSRALGLISTCALLALFLRRPSLPEPSPADPPWRLIGLGVPDIAPDRLRPARSLALPVAALVLIIDRDGDTRDALVALLLDLGLRVIQAADAQSGQRLLAEVQPDLIIMDGSILRGGGWSPARNPKPAKKAAFTIVLADPHVHHLHSFGENGFHYLAKPVQVKQLRILIASLLNG